jgi:hypothetical protein
METLRRHRYSLEGSIMDFDINRLAKLSGIKGEEVQSVLTESTDPLVVENFVRKMIREEIEAIVEEIETSGDASWIFSGMKKPQGSKGGHVTTSFPGIGFARKN